MAMATSTPKPNQGNKKASKRKIFRVLLDSGSDGDLLFHEKGTPKHFPYLTRQVPKIWHTSNGDFHTKGKSEVHLKFFEYSNSKRVLIHPDVVTCNKGDKPVLGIILDFKHKMITIDEIELPMQSIHKMPTSRRKALANDLANQKEPASTAEVTNHVVRILDANNKKANLQEVVRENNRNFIVHLMGPTTI